MVTQPERQQPDRPQMEPQPTPAEWTEPGTQQQEPQQPVPGPGFAEPQPPTPSMPPQQPGG